jgi:hypothetical protein
MTKNFDFFYEQLIKEVFTSKNKRRENRYGLNEPNTSSKIRAVRLFPRKTDSQDTKIGNSQQYVGNYWKKDGIRTNKSEKTATERAIANGTGGHLRIKGVNPKKPGAKVNSKQGDMEVKYSLGNGMYKVGKTGKTQFKNVEKIFSKPD